MKKSLDVWGIEVDQTIKDWAIDINSRALPRNGVQWSCTYGIVSFPENYMRDVFDAAMPHLVRSRDEMYGKWDEMNHWIDENEFQGLWTHTNIHYQFQFEHEATAFKIRWG